MSKFFKSDIGIIILIIVLFFVILSDFYLAQGLLSIDTGREFYIPQQMLNGEVLYKDIYNIYGALSYQINTILFAIFGAKITTLYWAGILNSLAIVITIYLLGREYMKKGLSFMVSITIMFSLVFSTFLYNSNLPYAYAISYALSSFLLSVLFLIKYIKTEDNKMAYLSCLFCGISLANKYEFTLLPFILVYVLGFLKPIGIKNGLKALGCFISVPAISYSALIIQGLNFTDIKETITLFKNLISAPLLKLFFEKFGVFFNAERILNLIVSNKSFAILGLLPIINTLVLAIFFKKIFEDKTLFVLILCAITACAKTFFYLNIIHMGAFMLPIIFLATICLIDKFTKQKIFVNTVLIASILLFLAFDITSLNAKNYELKTEKGHLYTYAKDGIQNETAIDFVLKNTNKTDKVVVMPEGTFINFTTERKGDNFYYNLSPLFYNDVFGEEKVINHFKESMPEYFIIVPINHIEYGSSYFGKDYAQNFYEMIVNNYELVEEKNNIKFFRKKI